jgi:hypothetical protein
LIFSAFLPYWQKSQSQARAVNYGLTCDLRKPELSQAGPKLGLSGQACQWPGKHYLHWDKKPLCHLDLLTPIYNFNSLYMGSVGSKILVSTKIKNGKTHCSDLLTPRWRSIRNLKVWL